MESERYVGQRGPDIEPREFNPKSLLNLKQFQKRITKANLSPNLGMNWSNLGKFAIIVFAISVLVWKLYQRKTHSENINTDQPDT